MIQATDSAAILASLEIASARGGDLTDAVYGRLFAAHPAMRDLFVRDTNGSIKGEMLARVFEMVLDYIDEGAYAEGMVRNEVTTHAGYDVPPDLFPIFFEVVAESLRGAAGEAWTPAMTRAWDGLLADFRRFAAHG